jgi:hypothetical protein
VRGSYCYEGGLRWFGWGQLPWQVSECLYQHGVLLYGCLEQQVCTSQCISQTTKNMYRFAVLSGCTHFCSGASL